MLRTALFAAGLMGVALGAQAQQDYVVLNPIPAFSQPLERGRDGNYYSVSNGYATFKVTPAGQYSYLGGVLVSATAVDGGDGYFYASSNRDIIRFAEGARPPSFTTSITARSLG